MAPAPARLPARRRRSSRGGGRPQSLRLAFAAALQHLSARQRGALILRDVLSFSASEAAEILGTTVVSVNSSLQRARARVQEAGVRQECLREPSAAEQRAWVDRYMKAFEQADVEGLKRLLTEDVVMEMPPMVNWFAGPATTACSWSGSSRRAERTGA